MRNLAEEGRPADSDALIAAALETAREDLGLELIFELDGPTIPGLPSVPVVAGGSRIVGALTARRHLSAADHRAVRALAGVLGRRLDGANAPAGTVGDQLARVRQLLRSSEVQTALQPIFDLENGDRIGYEALARFPSTPRLSPQVWFAEAEAAGLGLQLERLALLTALRHFPSLPGEAFLALNASPDLAIDRCLREAIRSLPHERIVIEMTEHSAIDDYDQFDERLRRRRHEGVRLAVDDAGAGFASLRHIVRLRPDLIKLDLSLVKGIDVDPIRQSLVAAITTFARSLGAAVVAEGIESAAELLKVQQLGVRYGQGFLLGMPELQALPEADSLDSAAS